MHQHVEDEAHAATGTGLVYHPDCLRHDTGPWHPEGPERLRAVLSHLDRTGLRGALTPIPARDAEPGWLTAVHRPEHVAQVEAACRMARGRHVFLDHETPVSEGSWDAIRKAAGGALAAVDKVMAGEVRNAFCLIRPPGHHAEPDRVMGFCLINNVAVAARYVQRRHGLARVAILDFDVHHGNGTQAAFWSDPSVLYGSIHQYPFYPGTGAASERGGGAGEGFTLNCPLAAGGGDKAFEDALENVLLPAAEAFGPDFVLVSAGFDAHPADPLGSMAVTEAGFKRLTRGIRRLADAKCGGRLVSVLEGGYDLDALGACVAAHLEALMEIEAG
jgi:acetoin utilization deacetylase AcuC-like enzyme